MGWSTLFCLTLLAEFIAGFFMPALHIGINTIVMSHTEAAFIGRVNGILLPLFMGAMVITLNLAGVLKEWIFHVVIYQISAALFVIGIVVMLPMLRMLQSTKTKSL
ncbi:hypothetical protein [Geobacillus sp. 46C-IIa]|uniref:hypothetical protein n=1 Tax=Geobacillus sp. 46C-IIa TaxID=1963025 RepID=UPI001CC1C2D1|nr:hypothetical protein [Geobacillus sp. 46C-IIa]